MSEDLKNKGGLKVRKILHGLIQNLNLGLRVLLERGIAQDAEFPLVSNKCLTLCSRTTKHSVFLVLENTVSVQKKTFYLYAEKN